LLAVLGAGSAAAAAACGPGDPAAPAETGGAAETAPAAAPATLIIRTILEDVPPDQLGEGAVLFHEHVSLNNQFWIDMNLERLIDPAQPYFMEDMDYMVAEMQAAAEDGIACIVDGGHADMGRDIEFVRALSERSGMPIVASGGYYHEPTFTPDVYERSEEDLVEEMVRDAAAERWGAFGGIGFTAPSIPAERKVLRAVGRAHLRTNLPIFTHTGNGVEAVEQLDLLEAVGVDPDRVVIGHLGYPDVTVHADLCRRGAYVGFDRLGGQPEADAAQVPMVVALIEGGFTDRVLLASDFALPADTRGNGGPGYGKTVTRFVPLLREAGVDDDTLRRMTSDNPRRFLSFAPLDA
jgi:phosphotriesterase-related protein